MQPPAEWMFMQPPPECRLQQPGAGSWRGLWDLWRRGEGLVGELFSGVVVEEVLVVRGVAGSL